MLIAMLPCEFGAPPGEMASLDNLVKVAEVPTLVAGSGYE
jgi:hypothetical protein